MKILHSFGIWVAYILVLQDFVHASIEIVDSFGRAVETFPNRYATVGDVTMEGYIESANPSDACTEIGPPTFPQNFTMKKIVLINGTSTCDFFTKVKNAKAVGYNIAVLFDPLPGPFVYPNLTFPLPISEINLSVVLVLSEDAIVIRNNYLYHNISDKENFIIKISANLTWVSYLSIAAFGFALSICMFVSLRWIYNCCIDIFGEQNEDDEDQNEDEENEIEALNVSLENYRGLLEFINRILFAERPAAKWTEEQRINALSNLEKRYPPVEFSEGQRFDTCAVCMENFEIGVRIRVLDCSHAYHTHCIDDWLVHKLKGNTCPLCIAKVNLENSCEQPPSDSTETTRLLASTHSLYSSTRRSNGGGHLESV